MGFEVDNQHNPLPETTITLLKGEGDAMIELIESIIYETDLYLVGMDVENITTTLKDPNGVRIALIQHI